MPARGLILDPSDTYDLTLTVFSYLADSKSVSTHPPVQPGYDHKYGSISYRFIERQKPIVKPHLLTACSIFIAKSTTVCSRMRVQSRLGWNTQCPRRICTLFLCAESVVALIAPETRFQGTSINIAALEHNKGWQKLCSIIIDIQAESYSIQKLTNDC